jgi:hypothetical protein
MEDDRVHPDSPASPYDKLTQPLQDLVEKVDKEGKDGDFVVGKIRVRDYKVAAMISLHDASAATLAKLKALGFQKTDELKTVKGIVIGVIDVRRLKDLANLDAVTHISPIVG